MKPSVANPKRYLGITVSEFSRLRFYDDLKVAPADSAAGPLFIYMIEHRSYKNSTPGRPVIGLEFSRIETSGSVLNDMEQLTYIRRRDRLYVVFIYIFEPSRCDLVYSR